MQKQQESFPNVYAFSIQYQVVVWCDVVIVTLNAALTLVHARATFTHPPSFPANLFNRSSERQDLSWYRDTPHPILNTWLKVYPGWFDICLPGFWTLFRMTTSTTTPLCILPYYYLYYQGAGTTTDSLSLRYLWHPSFLLGQQNGQSAVTCPSQPMGRGAAVTG